MSRIFGVEFCGLAKYHTNLDNPLDMYFTGPSAFKVYLKKTDTFSKYTFEYTWLQDVDNRDMDHINVVLDTPGSMVNRRSSVMVSFDRTTYSYLSLGVEVPVNNVMANFVYNWSKEKKLVKGALSVDRQIVATAYTLLKKTDAGRYEAEARMSYYSMQILHWTGLLSMTNAKSSIIARFESSSHNPVTLKGI